MRWLVISQRIFVCMTTESELPADCLYGNNIIKALNYANIFGKKFGSFGSFIILYP